MLTLIFEGDAIVLAVERLVLDTADFLRTLVLDMVEMVKVVVVAYSRNFSDTSAKESGMASERWLRSVDGFTKVMSMSMVISCMVARLVPMTSKVSKAVAVTIVLMVSMEAKATSMDLYQGHMEIRGPKMFVTFLLIIICLLFGVIVWLVSKLKTPQPPRKVLRTVACQTQTTYVRGYRFNPVGHYVGHVNVEAMSIAH